MANTIFFVSMIFQGIDIFIGLFLFSFYVYNFSIGRCKWEGRRESLNWIGSSSSSPPLFFFFPSFFPPFLPVLYVCLVGAMIDIVNISVGTANPAIVRLDSGGSVAWIRYVGWMLTCPALLVLLSNLAGESSYNHIRSTTMLMLDQVGSCLVTSGLSLSLCLCLFTRLDYNSLHRPQAMILAGVTSAISEDDAVKAIFIVIGSFCLVAIFVISRNIFKESHEAFPGRAKAHLIVSGVDTEGMRDRRRRDSHSTFFSLSQIMESCLFGPWVGYCVVFTLGPETLDIIDQNVVDLFLAILDLFSKSMYSYLAWDLRWRILRNPTIEGSPIQNKAEKQRVLLATEDAMHAVFFRQKMMHLKAEVGGKGGIAGL